MNRKHLLLLVFLTIVCSISSCGKSNASEAKTKESPRAEKKKALTVYFTGTGNTEKIAKVVAESAGTDLYKIEPETPYTTDDLNYNDDNCRANQEMQDASARPRIAGRIEDMEKYEVIYLGYPIWWGTTPRIINTFIESHGDALKGKTIVTFCTSGGSTISKSNEELKSAYPDINWVDGHRFEAAASKEDVEKWMDTVNLK